MKKGSLAVFLALCCLMGCVGGRSSGGSPSVDGGDTLTTDTADVDASDPLAEEQSMPEAADELFDDFFFNFAANKRLQKERISFPLLVSSEDGQEHISARKWQMDRFFMDQDYYTLIFDSPQQMEDVKDTTVDEAVVEKIFLDDEMVQQYFFNRKSGRWMLCEIRRQALQRNTNAPFLVFYRHFVSDSVFQHESLAAQMQFSGPDPDDDFRQLEGVITPDFWEAFAPELPSKMLYNIVYGHRHDAAQQKILVLRGIANGLEVEITFQLKHGRWKLTKLIT